MNHHPTKLDHFPILFQVALDLFRRPSPSGREDLVRAYVVQSLERHGFTVSIDAAGNVLAVRGRPEPHQGYPLLSFHMDCVSDETTRLPACATAHSTSPRQRAKRRQTGRLPLRPLEALAIDRGWIHSRGAFVLGGDDKCGGAIALTLAATTDLPLKIVASVQEEAGCLGIAQVDPQFFADVAYALVLDRRGANHLVVSIAGCLLCQGAFAAAMIRAAANSGLLVFAVEGALSDAHILARSIPNVVNMSVGYYAPHSVEEQVSLAALWHSYQWVYEALSSVSRTMPGCDQPTSHRTAEEALLCPGCLKLIIHPANLPADLWRFVCRCAEAEEARRES